MKKRQKVKIDLGHPMKGSHIKVVKKDTSQKMQ